MLPRSRTPRVREPITKSYSSARIGCTRRDRLRPVAAVAIEKHENFGFRFGRGGSASGTSPAIAVRSLDEHRRCADLRLRDRAIAAAAVDNDDFVDPLARYCREDSTDRSLLVEDRDDRGDADPVLGGHRLQRTPQEAQAGGGVSLNKARRNS